MDTTKLKKIIEIVRNSGVSELEISDGQEKIRIVNNNFAVPESKISEKKESKTKKEDVGNQIITAQESKDLSTPVPENQKIVKSPMVGTFYRATAPGAEPLAEIGQNVKKGDVLCIIEAMKLMNEIISEYNGVIKDILVNNEQPVEYGEALFEIE